jgi:hypothetical protein
MIIMLDIKKEIQIVLLKRGLSMSKMTRTMQIRGIKNINIASLSRMLTTETIKFKTVQEILDFLGYEIEIREKQAK